MTGLSPRSLQILARIREGKNFAAVAREFGCSREWVRDIAARNGIVGRDKVIARHSEIVQDIVAGVPYKIIGAQHGITAHTVYKIARKNGIRRQKKADQIRTWDSESIKFLCAHKGRKTARELAAELGVTRNSVISVWNRYGGLGHDLAFSQS